MTWTYAGAPGTGSTAAERDAVRFWVGDTDSADPLVTDEEIGFSIDNHGSLKFAAVEVARAIAAKYGRSADKAVGDLSIKLSQRSEAYRKLADSLELGEVSSGIGIYAGGISLADKDSREADSDRVAPAFTVDQFSFTSYTSASSS